MSSWLGRPNAVEVSPGVWVTSGNKACPKAFTAAFARGFNGEPERNPHRLLRKQSYDPTEGFFEEDVPTARHARFTWWYEQGR